LESVELVRLGEEEVEHSNDSTLELSALVGPDGNRGEGLPEDLLADVGGDEEGDTRAETVSFLEELVEHQDHESGKEKLSNNEDRVDESELSNGSVHSTEKISKSLSKSDEEAEEFRGSLVKLSVFLGLHVDVDDLGTNKELHDHA